MKPYFLIVAIGVAMPVAAYETGPVNRANFGSAQQPVVQQNGYRSFSNYNSRGWNQGVQTKPVQTSLAGSSVTEFDSASANRPAVGKQAAASPKQAKPATTVAATPTQPSSTTAAMPANMDPSAMMQQVQGMMQNMQAATGAMSGAAPSTGGQAGGMPAIPGMPDMSALMGGAMATPPATPAKK